MNKFTLQYRCLGPSLLGLLVVTGCSQDLQPAGGKVLVDGVPVKDGTIMFSPLTPGRSATARIMEDGSFTLSFEEQGDGLPEGEYRVSIVSDIFKELPKSKFQEMEEEMAKKSGAIDDLTTLTGGELIHVVPPIYNDVTTTPLRQKVAKSSQPQEFVFDIPSGKKK